MNDEKENDFRTLRKICKQYSTSSDIDLCTGGKCKQLYCHLSTISATSRYTIMVIENTDGLEENIPFDIKISNIVTDFDVPNFLKFIGKFLSRQTK